METDAGNYPSVMRIDLFSEGNFLLDCQVHNIPLERGCIKHHHCDTLVVFNSREPGSAMRWGANCVL